MNTTLTLQEILKEYGFTKLPKGTTEQQWFDYHEKVSRHEERVVREMPDPENYPTEKSYDSAVSEWKMMRSCDAPDQPGYYRANND
jgi:hypothetical protein